MKKNILFLTFIAFSAHVFSQITITRSHLVVPGKKVVEAYDQTPRPLPATGTNMTWNFTGLNADLVDSLRFGVAGWYPGHSDFPNANMALIYYDNDSSIDFLGMTDTELKTYGSYMMTDSGDFSQKFELRVLTFPSTYNTSFTDVFSFPGFSFPLGFDPDSSGPIPLIDSIQVSFKYTSNSRMTGWGTVQTPDGNYSGLQQTTQTITTPNVKMFSNGFGIDLPASLFDLIFQGQLPTGDTSYTVNFWTNDATMGFPIISYDYAQGDDSISQVTWMMGKLKNSSVRSLSTDHNFAYPNPVRQYLTINCPVENGQVAIFDMNGQLVLEQTLGGLSHVSVQHLATGLYMLQLTDVSNGNIISMQKISKQ
jgi:hypothetical protein